MKGCLVADIIVFAAVFVSVPVSAIFNQSKAIPLMPWGMGALGLTVIVLWSSFKGRTSEPRT